MNTDVRLTFEKVRFDTTNDVHLVVSVTAPKIDWQAKRSPICIVPSIDVSGSMDGEKLANAKKAVLKLFDHLQPGDYAGLVEFGSMPRLVHKVVPITPESKDALKAKVGNLRVMGSTNFAGGMTTALEAIASADLPPAVISRVVMFTDGCANVGVATKAADLVTLLDKVRGKSSVSAFGYGSDADSELMATLSKEGNGNYAFIKNPEDALSAFAKELGGLLSVYGQNITIAVSTHGDNELTEVLSDVDVEEDKELVKIKLGDVLSEETRHVVAAFKLAKQGQAFPRNVTVADVILEFDVLGNDGKLVHKSETLKAKVRFVKEGEQQSKATAELDNIVGLAQMVKAQIEAEEAAKRGDWNGASGIFVALNDQYLSRGLSGLASASASIGSTFTNSANYQKSSALRSSVYSATGSRSYGTFTTDETAKGIIADLGLSGSNATMDAMDASFKADVQPPAASGATAVPPVWSTATVPPIEPAAAPLVPPADLQKVADSLAKRITKSKSRRW